MTLLYALVVIGSVGLLAIYSLRAALLLSVFMLPWTGLDIDIGLRLTTYQLVIMPIVVVAVLRLLQPGFTPPPIPAGGWFAVFMLYAVIWSLLQLGFIPQLKVGDSVLRSPSVRALLQIGVFLFAIVPVVLTPLAIDRADDILRMGRLFIASMVVLALIGWVQLAIWYVTGNNPIPIEAFGAAFGGLNADDRSGAFGVDALYIYRMNSLAGEPRELAIGLVVALLLIQAHALTAVRVPALRLATLWAFLFLSLLATFSTSGFVIFVIASLATLPGCWLFRVAVRRSGRVMALAASAVIAPFALAITVIQSSGFDIIAVLASRTIERLTSDGAVEDFDRAIIAFFEVHPDSIIGGLGLGNVHLYAGAYLDPLFALYAEGNVFIGKTFYLRYISEIGIIGFALLIMWFAMLMIRTRIAVGQRPDLAGVVPVAGTVLVAAMSTSLLTPAVYAVAGAMAAACVIAWRSASAPAAGSWWARS